MVGPIQGTLLTYETFTAFLSSRRAARGTMTLPVFDGNGPPGMTFSAFRIMVNNRWMQVPVGYAVENGIFAPPIGARSSF